MGDRTSVVGYIDHVSIETQEPEQLHEFLNEVLGLPVAFPYQVYGDTHQCGGVASGGCWLEAVRYLQWPSGRLDPHVRVLSFAPSASTAGTLAELDRRGVAYLDPSNDVVEGQTLAGDVVGWTLTSIDSPFRSALWLALCEYHHDVGARRRVEDQAVVDSDSPFGIRRLDRVVITSPAAESARRNLGSLLGSSDGEVFRLDEGPAIEVTEGSTVGVALVFETESLTMAAAAAGAAGIGTLRIGQQLHLEPDDAFGMDLRLVEAS